MVFLFAGLLSSNRGVLLGWGHLSALWVDASNLNLSEFFVAWYDGVVFSREGEDGIWTFKVFLGRSRREKKWTKSYCIHIPSALMVAYFEWSTAAQPNHVNAANYDASRTQQRKPIHPSFPPITSDIMLQSLLRDILDLHATKKKSLAGFHFSFFWLEAGVPAAGTVVEPAMAL
jgi:hypothetical protein